MSARRLPSLSFMVFTTVALWLATAVAALALWPIYQSIQLVIVVIAALTLGTALACISARFRWPGFVVVLATVAGFLLFGVPLANPSGAHAGLVPTPAGELDLLKAAAFSWKQLVTITIPVGSYQTLLVPALILILVSTVVSVSISLRSRLPELAVIPPVIVFISASVFGPTFAFWPREIALALLGVVLVWLVWLRAHKRRASIRLLAANARDAEGRPLETVADRGLPGFRAAITTVLILLISGAASFGATQLLPPLAQREVLRTSVQQPFNSRGYASPLSGFRSYEKAPVASAPMLTVTGLPVGARIRIATLDSYDGVVYAVGSPTVASESGSFTRVPYTFDQRSTPGTTVSLTVRVGGYTGVWVPTVGQFESVDFDGQKATTLRDSFFYNNLSGTAAVITPLVSGDKYTLTGVIPAAPTESQLTTLSPGAASVPRIGVLPDSVRSTLDTWTSAEASPGAKLAAMLAALKKNGYVSHGVSPNEPASRSGHAADRITELLTSQRMIGDQEQYAVTAALMARQLGFPARVVFGFAPTDTSATGATIIVGSDISAWIEVNTQQFGWVTLDPTPPIRDIPVETPQTPTTIARPQSPVQPPVNDPTTQSAPTQPSKSQDASTTPNPLVALLLVALKVLCWSVVGIALVLSPFLLIIVAKARRRSLRRHARTPVERISGGWQEFEDAVLDHGYNPPASHTRSEVAATIGGSKSRILAAVADRAAFSPGQPASEEAETVWVSVTALRAALGAKLTRWQRVKALISLRSLGGYSVKNLFKRQNPTN